MKLSEELESMDNCGDFGNALTGYPEKAKKLEDLVVSLSREIDTHFSESMTGKAILELVEELTGYRKPKPSIEINTIRKRNVYHVAYSWSGSYGSTDTRSYIVTAESEEKALAITKKEYSEFSCTEYDNDWSVELIDPDKHVCEQIEYTST